MSVALTFFTSNPTDYWQNLPDEDVHKMLQTALKVQREAHRFPGLVRFQTTAEGMFFALFEPDHNIWWLISNHFKSRYATQPICDTHHPTRLSPPDHDAPPLLKVFARKRPRALSHSLPQKLPSCIYKTFSPQPEKKNGNKLC